MKNNKVRHNVTQIASLLLFLLTYGLHFRVREGGGGLIHKTKLPM